ncbi:hypothetical protein L596_022778 [Steinernema carpocapsae]|uniref:Uncharacterized protein n=1 Tax=Steinernema carpocapsae TaxID=34508 RepID=A0A4U5MP94_STECR|nr:hypothetical protein L596_022778 [Steinernema carpocapsae]
MERLVITATQTTRLVMDFGQMSAHCLLMRWVDNFSWPLLPSPPPTATFSSYPNLRSQFSLIYSSMFSSVALFCP